MIKDTDDNIIQFQSPKQRDLSAELLNKIRHECYVYLSKMGNLYLSKFQVDIKSLGKNPDNASASILVTFKLKE